MAGSRREESIVGSAAKDSSGVRPRDSDTEFSRLSYLVYPEMPLSCSRLGIAHRSAPR